MEAADRRRSGAGQPRRRRWKQHHRKRGCNSEQRNSNVASGRDGSRRAAASLLTNPRVGRHHADGNSIEEQLRLQRLRRKQRREEESSSMEKDANSAEAAPPANKKRLGRYMYDPERDAYFEESFVQREEQRRREENKTENDDTARRESSSRNRSSCVLSYNREILGLQRQRQTLTSRWRGRLFLERLQARRFGSQTGFYARPFVESSAKWNRTFDVVLPRNDGGNAPAEGLAPFLVRIGRECVVLERSDHPRDSAYPYLVKKGTHVKAISSEHSSQWVVLEQSENATVAHVFRMSDLDNILVPAFYYTGRLFPGINDCAAWHGDSSFGGTSPILYGGPQGKLYWTNNELGRDEAFGELGCRMLPKSDIMTVETEASRPNSSVLGHRNGQISLLDFRANETTSCSSSARGDSSAANGFGSVVALNLLFAHRPHHLLARGSLRNGFCRLYDVRMFSSQPTAAAVSAGVRKDPSVVHEFQMPPTRHHQDRSKGVATDPYQTVALLPFVDRSATARLGVWSLDSGEFVGSKSLVRCSGGAFESGASTNVADCLELCPKITHAYTPKQGRGEAARSNTIPGSFGLWLNWGSRGIYHIVI